VDSRLHRRQYRPEAPVPLAGVRVVDLSRLVAGNMTSHLLADFGAEVIKVEDPRRGDDLRDWKVDDVATYWKVYSRSKKSLALDYRSEAGLAVARKLIAGADVLIENFVPGKLERLGLAPEVLLASNPRLVILRVSGWGQTGPARAKPGFGTIVEAMSGFAAMNGFPGLPPVLPPLALADMIAGLYGATAIMVALRHSEATGEGQVIDLSLFEPILSVLGPEAANHALTGQTRPRLGSRATNAAPRNVYVCSDGKYVALSASMQSMAERLFRAIGRDDLVDDPAFRTNGDRLRNIDALDEIIAAFMAERTQAENLGFFGQAGVTVGPVCDVADLLVEPHIVERESLVALPDEEMGDLPMHNIVARLSATAGAIRTPAPALGEHTEAILDGLGLTRPEIEQLRASGVVSVPAATR
jgi:formyl-CoA transferase